MKERTENKTVLFTIDLYHIGGVTTFVSQYAQALLHNGYRVIILGMPGNLENPELFFPGCTTIIIPKKIEYSFFARIKNSIKYIYHIHKLFNLFNIQIVHLSTTWSAFYTLLYWKTWKIKKVITFYGAYDLEMKSQDKFSGNSMLSRITQWGRKHAQKILFHLCDKTVIFSDYSAMLLRRHFGFSDAGKIMKLPGYISTSKLHGIIKRKQVRKSLDAPSLLFIGRAEPRKGVGLLLKACQLLSLKRMSYHLRLASPVEYFSWYGMFQKYERLNLLTKVHFLHAVTDEQKEELFSQTDLFIIPSVDLETFGMVILESLAQGIPVVGTPAGAITEILHDIHPKLVADSISSEALADRIQWFFHLSNRQKTGLSKRRIQHIQKHFLLEKNYHKIMKIYESNLWID